MAMRTRVYFAAALAAALIACGAAGASAATLNAEYSISLAGLLSAQPTWRQIEGRYG